jgi:hypothetical protein
MPPKRKQIRSTKRDRSNRRQRRRIDPGSTSTAPPQQINVVDPQTNIPLRVKDMVEGGVLNIGIVLFLLYRSTSLNDRLTSLNDIIKNRKFI